MSRVLVGAGGRVGEEVQVEQGSSGPAQFWRGQTRYAVGELLDSWVETAPWWQADAGGGASAELVATRQVWRVEAVRAGRSRMDFAGVFDLSWEPTANQWLLVRVHD
ncbi:DUF6504 family protein [Modestobacter versicolor]|uniref:DUF6504 domain-containing protein n=1 Tax=Modestobacter versicolor TaxID=429133 RepID=A0A323V9Z7_9ACTN|nr:DUF6504 family protein [Modestobacter versicolor]MBB3675641.1 hypothetical protein [Modestobacter versicolor]PZA20930.1 hypothetical protein DMO24_12935 [Modestobacter versicolor]